MDKTYYCNYHTHTCYSNINVLDSIASIKDYCKRANELGLREVFTTEHGYQGFVFEWLNIAQEYGLKVIEGAEVYYVADRFDKTDRQCFHLIVIALNDEGAKQLNKMVSRAYVEGYYYRPRIDHDLLFGLNADDFVITTACIGGMWHNRQFIEECYTYFGNHFFLELQNHDDTKQKEVNKRLLNLHYELGIPIIHGNDSHYIYPEDSQYRNLFIRAKRKETSNAERMDDEEHFILDFPDYQTIVTRYRKQGILNDEEIFEALENTKVFMHSGDLTHYNMGIKLPSVVKNPKEELRKIVINEWQIAKSDIQKEHWSYYEKEIIHELRTIEECGMSAYFVDDYYIAKIAREKYGGILTKTGRGSAVSFFINKLLGLTNIDRISAPITLFPSRFMSKARILESASLPDIDLNMHDQRPFIQASYDLLGEDNCKWMLSFKPLQDASAFRLYCKALGMDIKAYDAIAKDLDTYRSDTKWTKIIDESKRFIGVISAVSISPCSMLLYDKPVDEEIGLITIRSKNEETKEIEVHTCCLMDGYNCDRWKYLKNDYLLVTVISIISKTCEKIGIAVPSIKELEYLISKDDLTWKIYELGLTCTINQADSDFGRNCAMRYKPRSIPEMSAFIAILRPGCESLRDDFLDRKPYSTGVEKLDALLEDGANRMIYQELIMKYLIWLGIEEDETYTIIKKISKKKFSENELKILQEKLRNGWIEQVGSIEGFDKTWAVVKSAARYSFNASHSLSYAYDSIYGAYLKSHYPLEYFATAFELYHKDSVRTAKLTNELEYFGIKLMSVSFGFSKAEYTYDRELRSIYKGIMSIKYMNKMIADELYELSKKKTYQDFVELLLDIRDETHLTSKQLEGLICLGFFEHFGKNRYLLDVVDVFRRVGKIKQVKKSKLDELGLSEDVMRRFALKETALLFKDINVPGMVRYLTRKLENRSLDIRSQVKAELEFLDYVEYVNRDIEDEYYIAIDIKMKRFPIVTLRKIRTGDELTAKVKHGYQDNPIETLSIIHVNRIDQQNKWAYMGKGEDGKPIYEMMDEMENVLSDYEVIKY